jgi:hypothetical protein
VTAWGLAPARGRIRFCGTCGAFVIFGLEKRPGKLLDGEANRLTLATKEHFRESPRCAKGDTFSGAEILACRCPRAVPVAREDGLYCARCEGLVAPHLAAVSQSRRPSGGTP